MLSGIKFNSADKGESNHQIFDEIRESCRQEIEHHGFANEIYLLHGGVGVKILESDHPSFSKISHLPIKEFNFSYDGIANLSGLEAHSNLEGIIFSKSKLLSFSSLNHLNLKRIHADGTQVTDFNSLKTTQIIELSLKKN